LRRAIVRRFAWEAGFAVETAAAAAARGDGGLVPGPAVLGAALERAGALVAAVRDRCCGLLTEEAAPPGPS